MQQRKGPSGPAESGYPIDRQLVNLTGRTETTTEDAYEALTGAELYLNDIRENQQISAEMLGACNQLGAGSRSGFRVQAEFLDSSNVVLSTSTVCVDINNYAATEASEYRRIVGTGVVSVPADAVRCRLYAEWGRAGATGSVSMGGDNTSFRLVGEVYAAGGVATAANTN